MRAPILFLLITTGLLTAQDGLGGARSAGLSRDVIAAGGVPAPASFTVDGLLAEHDFPLSVQRPEDFTVLSALGRGLHRPSGEQAAWLMLEPVSGLDPRTARPHLDLALVIDRSGSMQGWKLRAALASVHALVDQLGPRDRLALVVFDHVAELVLPNAPVVDREALHAAVDGIFPGGSTDLESGLRIAFEQLETERKRVALARRVIVWTDALPNTGDTSDDGFKELVARFAAERIGLTVIGVGLDLRAELAHLLAQFRGGNAYYLAEDGVEELVGRFEAMLQPVAYDLSIELRPAPGLSVAAVYGVPEENVLRRPDGSLQLRAATVFFEARRNGLIVRLSGAEEAVRSARVGLSWSYEEPATGRRLEGAAEARHEPRERAGADDFARPAQRRAYILASFAELFATALQRWEDGQPDEARASACAARCLLAAHCARQEDGLGRELAMAERLLDNMGGHRH